MKSIMSKTSYEAIFRIIVVRSGDSSGNDISSIHVAISKKGYADIVRNWSNHASNSSQVDVNVDGVVGALIYGTDWCD